MEPVDDLLRYPLFALLERPALEAWVQAGQVLAVQSGQALLQAGTPGHHAFILLSGKVRVSRPTQAGHERSLGVLGPGEAFGEYALLPPHNNTATCRACEPARVLRLPLAPLRQALRSIGGMDGQLKSWLRLHALVGQLRQGSGLGFVSGPSLVALMERCREVSFSAARTLQADGLLDDSWLYITAGEIALHEPKDTSAPPCVLGPGGCFGERALLGRGRLPTAVSLADSTCWLLARDDFLLLPGGVSSGSQTLRQKPPERLWEWLAQRRPADCGVAALAMALRGHGLAVSLEEVASLTALGPDGASLAALAGTAARLRVRPASVRVGIDQLGQARLPAVAHLNGGHYVTLFEARPAELVVGDPASGVRTMPLAAFRQAWSGHLLLLQPTAR